MKPTYDELETRVSELEQQLTHANAELVWSALSQSPVPTMIVNIRDGKIIRYNDGMHKLTGYSPQDVPDDETWLAALFPEETVRREMREIINTGMSHKLDLHEYEALITRRDGQKRCVEFSLYSLQNILMTQDSADYRVIEALNVTERKNAVEELKQANAMLRVYNEELDRLVLQRTKELEESEDCLRMALEGANEGLWVIDFAAGKMSFSSNSAAMLGYSLDELGTTSAKWDKITHPDDWPLVQQRLMDHFDGKTPFYEAEYRARTKNGDCKWILGHGRVVKWNKDGTPLQAIGTHVDITKLKEAEIELRKSERKFRSLVEQAPFGLLMVRMNGRIEYFNPQFQEIFGYSETDILTIEEWIEKAYPDRSYRKEIKSVWDKLIDEMNEELFPQGHQSTAFCKNGEYKIVRMMVVTLNQKGWMLVYENISDIAKARDALEKREKELQYKNTTLEELNTTLKVLLRRNEDDKNELEEKVFHNVRDLVLPYITELEQSRLTERQSSILSIITSNLNEIISPFSRRLAAGHLNLTPKELKVANLLKQDKTTAEISELLCVSESAVVFHRHNIRKKLGLVGEKANLKTYLQSITNGHEQAAVHPRR